MTWNCIADYVVTAVVAVRDWLRLKALEMLHRVYMGKKHVLKWSDSVWVEHPPCSWGQRMLVGVRKSPITCCSPLNQTSVWLILKAAMFYSHIVPLNLLPSVFASSVYLKICIVFQSGFQITKVIQVLVLGWCYRIILCLLLQFCK